jgi:dehydration protein DpgD
MGLELTLAMDLAVPADGTQFGLLEVRNGRVGGTGVQRMVRQVPMKHALGVILTGRRVPAHSLQLDAKNRYPICI